MAAKKQYKLDLFKGVFPNINLKNAKYFDNLSEEEIKEFQPVVIMRWLTGCKESRSNPPRQIVFINEFVNRYVYMLGKHKKLLYYLMTITTVGVNCNYKYIKKHNRKSKYPRSTEVIQKIFNYSKLDAQDAVSLITKTEIVSMAMNLGYQDPEIKEIKQELKNKPA